MFQLLKKVVPRKDATSYRSTLNQSCGSGSAWILIIFGKLGPDPHQSGKMDPDMHQSEKVEALEVHFEHWKVQIRVKVSDRIWILTALN